MTIRRMINAALALGLTVLLAACGGGNSSGGKGLFGLGGGGNSNAAPTAEMDPNNPDRPINSGDRGRSKFWDLFGKHGDANATVKVNKYIWDAALDVLNFLPIESVDPFTGVIVTGYGTAPGSGRAYRATIYVQDPALDARSLKLAMQTKGGGAVAPETIKAVEDAILSRARQLRIADGKL